MLCSGSDASAAGMGATALIENRRDAPSGWELEQEHSTALKWSSDGELSALDFGRILSLLADVDPVASNLDPSHFGNDQR